MYTFAGGKDESITASTFLPQWWFEADAAEPEEEFDREALAARVARVMAAAGGREVGGS